MLRGWPSRTPPPTLAIPVAASAEETSREVACEDLACCHAVCPLRRRINRLQIDNNTQTLDAKKYKHKSDELTEINEQLVKERIELRAALNVANENSKSLTGTIENHGDEIKLLQNALHSVNQEADSTRDLVDAEPKNLARRIGGEVKMAAEKICSEMESGHGRRRSIVDEAAGKNLQSSASHQDNAANHSKRKEPSSGTPRPRAYHKKSKSITELPTRSNTSPSDACLNQEEGGG